MTTSITLRASKGSPLTHNEVDANFANLKTTADNAAADSAQALNTKANAAALGVLADDANMGTFSGSTIADGATAKQALQSLETAVESASGSAALKANATAVGVAASAADLGTFTGSTIPDNQTAKAAIQALETATEARVVAADLASTASGKGSALSGHIDDGASAVATTVRDFLRQFKHYTSGQFYSESGAKIQRLRDRVFVGAASDHNGTNSGTQPDWLTTYLISKGRTFGFQHIATMAVLSEMNTAGQNAFVAGARTSELTAVGNAIGILGVGVNNNSSYATGAWGGYFEGFQNSGQTGAAYAAEFNTINFNSAGDITPYAQAADQVVALQVASGAEFTGALDCHAAINVRNNGARYRAGIVFGDTSLTGTDGTGTGTAIAIRMARGHGLQWMSSNTIVTTQIFSTSATQANSTTLTFGENATLFSNSNSGKNLFGIVNIGATAVNYVQMQASAAGNPTQVLAAGDDTNIDLQFIPKGTGVMSFGTWTSNADAAVNGYVTIKDASGNLRKLATIA